MNQHLYEALASHVAIIITLIISKIFEERKNKQRYEFQVKMLREQDKEIAHIKKSINGVKND